MGKYVDFGSWRLAADADAVDHFFLCLALVLRAFSVFAIQIGCPDYDIVMHNSIHTKIVHDSYRV